MTIAKRLLLFIGVQLLLLAGLAFYGWQQFAVIEERSSFLATNVTPSLAIFATSGITSSSCGRKRRARSTRRIKIPLRLTSAPLTVRPTKSTVRRGGHCPRP